MLAILTTHPIQYQVPLWRALARDGTVPFEVWFLSRHGSVVGRDPGFGESFAWDVDLLTGYPHRFLDPSARDVTSFTRVRLGAEARALMRSSTPQALLVCGWNVAAYWQAARQAARLGIRVWMRGESNDLGERSAPRRALRRYLHSRLFGYCDEFLYIGSANRRLYESHGISPERLHFTPYAVDNERFSLQSGQLRSERDAIRAGWRIPADSYCVLFAGKLIPKKNPLDLVAAVGLLRDESSPVHLLFAGAGALRSKLRAACSVSHDADLGGEAKAPERGGRPPASFTGFLNQNEIARAYVAADCLVLPSDSGETWGLVVNEAMATGLPCAVSDACGCAEDLVRPLSRRLTFPAGDVAALAAAIRDLRSQPPARSRILEQISGFTVQRSVDTIRALWLDSRSGRAHEAAGPP